MKIFRNTLLALLFTLTSHANVTPRIGDIHVQIYGSDVNGDPTYPWEINSSGWGSVDVQHSVLPDGAATESTLSTANGHLTSIDSDIDVSLSTRASEATLAAFQSANHTDLLGVQSRQDTTNSTLVETNLRIGDEAEAAATTDTSTSGLNGLIKRLLQRMTTLIAFYSANFGIDSGGIRVNAQVGNSTGAAAFGAGVTNAQTVRVASNLYDGSANAITSQVNGAQRALDVGINVAGTQVDPRTQTVRSDQPGAFSSGTQQIPTLNEYGMIAAVPQHSILTTWGKMYAASSGYVSIGGAAAPYFMLRNPVGSGVICRIHSLYLASPQSGNVTYEVFMNPSLLTNGTSLPAIGGRTTGQSTALCVASRQPTVTANGSLIFSENVPNQSSGVIVPPASTRILDPGDEIMIVVDQSLAGQAGAVNIEWSEQP